jgi:enolase-phosphatase E1
VTSSTRAFDGVVVDIEGTTTPLSYVYDVLFPYARDRLRDFLASHETSLVDALELLCEEWKADVARGEEVRSLVGDDDGGASAWAPYVEWLMDRDRKSPGLKLIQGRIWDGGFASGALRGVVYPDVAPAFARWKKAGAQVAIYSSGSVLAQRQLFSHSTAGDLTGDIDSYFDTGVGAKREESSYRRIATAMGLAPDRIVFISDVAAELDAACDAGFDTRLCVREEEVESRATAHSAVSTFDSVDV